MAIYILGNPVSGSILQGADGAEITYASFVGNDIVFTKSNSETVVLADAVNVLQGPQGIQGETGLQGPQGLVGPEGPQGLKGETGENGGTPEIIDYNWWVNGVDTGVSVLGVPGDYTEFRYAVSTSYEIPPIINRFVRRPPGWDLVAPTTPVDYYLWQTQAVVSGVDNDVLNSTAWSVPVRIQGIDGSSNPSVVLSATRSTIYYDPNGLNPDPSTTTFIAWAFNTIGTIYYRFADQNGVLQNSTSLEYLYIIPPEYSEETYIVYVEILKGSSTGAVLHRSAFPINFVKKAADGEDGKSIYTLSLYQRAATSPTKPTNSTTYTFATNVLSGTFTPWTQSLAAWSANTNPVWVTQATISGSDPTYTIPASAWSAPFQLVKDGAPGAPGAPGSSGPSVVYRGIYSSSETYYGNTKRCDIVRNGAGGAYYMANVSVGGSFIGQSPTNTTYWSEFGTSFSSVATELLFAEMAYVNNLGVRVFQGSTEIDGTLAGNTVTQVSPGSEGVGASQLFYVNAPYDYETGYFSGTKTFKITPTGGTGGPTYTLNVNSSGYATTLAGALGSFASDNYTTINTLSNTYGITFVVTDPTIDSPEQGTIRVNRDVLQLGDFTYEITVAGDGDTGWIQSGSHTNYVSPSLWIYDITITGSGGRCEPKYGLTGGFSAPMVWGFGAAATIDSTIDQYITAYNISYWNKYNINISRPASGKLRMSSLVYGISYTTPTCQHINIPADQLGRVNIQYNEIYEDNATGFSTIYINRRGYAGRASVPRILEIGNGQGYTLLKVEGSTINRGSVSPSLPKSTTITYSGIDYNNYQRGALWVDVNGFVRQTF